MRLDKFLSETGTLSRSESKKAAKSGRICINGLPVRDTSLHISPESDKITLDGAEIKHSRYTYIMLNKPDGLVSATEDEREETVLSLLPENLQKIGLFPCGRLDKNTLGLLLLTNNGELAHYMLSPSRHVEKTYRFECASPLSQEDVNLLCRGVDIGEKSSTREAKVTLFSPASGEITVTEGKFHQIKRMFLAVENKITFLERTAFAGIPLDASLPRGEWRFLTEEEISIIEKSKPTK